MKKLLFLLCCALSAVSSYGDAKKPNIIYILADDMGLGDLGCYGQKYIQTPNIDKLADGGLKFTNHYSGSAVCAPSRCTLITGVDTSHATTRSNTWSRRSDEGQPELAEDAQTIAHILKDAGYRTAIVGKWGLGGVGTYSVPTKMGFDEFFGYICQAKAHTHHPDYLWHNEEKFVIENNHRDKLQYAPTLIYDYAMKFLEKSAKTPNVPFFLYYATTLPHTELISSKKYMDKYIGKVEPEMPAYKGSKPFSARFIPLVAQEYPHAAYAAMINDLDDQVGSIVDFLKEKNLLDNTLIIVTSDNGANKPGGLNDPDFFGSTSGLRGYKSDLYEGGIRAPMIAYWNGTIKKGQSNVMSAFWDMMPTFAQLAGQTPKYTDGISMVPTFLGQEQKLHDSLYWEFHNKRAVRKGDWKLVVFLPQGKKEGSVELYNLANDRAETKNVAQQNPEKTAELLKIIEDASI